LAAAAKTGRAFFVIYHLGPLAPELAGPAAHRAWIHFSDASIGDEPSGVLAAGLARTAARAGSRAAVHVERGLPLELLETLWAAGAALVFLTPPSDDRSLLRPVERRAARRRLPVRAYHLSTSFLP
jgi:cysteine synthase